MSSQYLFVNDELQAKLRAQAADAGLDPHVVLDWANLVEINHGMLTSIENGDAVLAAGVLTTQLEPSFSLTDQGMSTGEALAREAGFVGDRSER